MVNIDLIKIKLPQELWEKAEKFTIPDEFLSSMRVNNINITLELNNSFDIYSLNDITDGINYKLVMNHAPSDISNPILDLLDLFYNNIHYKEELFDVHDINMFKKYKIYKH